MTTEKQIAYMYMFVAIKYNTKIYGLLLVSCHKKLYVTRKNARTSGSCPVPYFIVFVLVPLHITQAKNSFEERDVYIYIYIYIYIYMGQFEKGPCAYYKKA